MSIFRKIVSFLILAAGIVFLLGLCLSTTMQTVWQAFGQAFQPFNFDALTQALAAFFVLTGNAIVLVMLGIIGLTMPNKHH